jgi:hypothetical protein
MDTVALLLRITMTPLFQQIEALLQREITYDTLLNFMKNNGRTYSVSKYTTKNLIHLPGHRTKMMTGGLQHLNIVGSLS